MSYFDQDDKEVLAPNSDVIAATTTTATTATHGIEVATEFKPVEHPDEPLDNDLPIQCPLPEPSILNVTSMKKMVLCCSVYRKLLVLSL